MATKSFYIDLDFIFDTRMSLLHRLDPEWIKRDFNEREYRNRTSDRFATESTNFTQAEWDDAWAKRDLEVLQNSLVTNGVKTLHETIASIDWGVDPSDTIRTINVTINCWPYRDLTENSKQAICHVVAGLSPVVINVGSCYIAPEHLFISEAAQRFDLMFHYNPFVWFAAQKDHLETTDFMSLWIVAPALLWGDLEELKTNPILKSFDAFTLTEMITSSKFTLRYIPVSDVCLLKPKA